MNIKRIAFVWVALLISVQCIVLHAQISSEKARIVVVTDLGGQDPGSNAAFDPDDTQSMVHLLVCSNMVDIEGIVSAMAWTTEPNRTKYIHRLVEQFAEVLPNLHRQASGYPTIDHIRSIVKQGPLVAHMDGVGEGKDTPGSDWIISVVDRDDPRPVWLTTWAGMSPIAQALWKVRNSRSSEEVKKFIRKVRIYDVLGQDDCGAWVAKNFGYSLHSQHESLRMDSRGRMVPAECAGAQAFRRTLSHADLVLGRRHAGLSIFSGKRTECP